MIPRRWFYILPTEYKQILKPSPALLENKELVTHWEKDFAEYINIPYAISVPSGRVGLKLILEFLKVNSGDEVIIPALTLKALAKIIQSRGATPICADVDKITLNVSPATIRTKITTKTKAIIVLHTFGIPCEIEEICKLAEEYQIAVIEDCAHACGARYKGKYVGTYGFAGFFSFDISKPINTYGGGMVVTKHNELFEYIKKEKRDFRENIAELKKKAKSLKLEQALYKTKLMYPILLLRTVKPLAGWIENIYRSIQTVPPEDVNYSPLQASLGIEKLASLSLHIEQRLEIIQIYRKYLSDKIYIPYISPDVIPSYYMFVVLTPKKSRTICRSLLLRGIDSAIENEIIDYIPDSTDTSDCKNAQEIYPYLLGLPLYDGMSNETVEYICNTLNQIV